MGNLAVPDNSSEFSSDIKILGLTLWVVPPRPDAERLKAIMGRFCSNSKSTGSGSLPKFEPHITLAKIPAGMPLSAVRKCIPQGQIQLDVTFKSVEMGSHYFRSVYIAVDLSPELTTLHQKVHAALQTMPETPAFPHISLCYVLDMDAEKGLRHQIFRSLRLKEDNDGIALDCGGGADYEDRMTGFKADEIWVTKCEGPVETWEVVDIIELPRLS
ncbi:hypothetical protein APHAL10511_001087 [Amanita phalloides]|nr:hypothetical protein APHAL10511_001087 [Amanita phalloides]